MSDERKKPAGVNVTISESLTAEQAAAIIAALASTLGVPAESVTVTDKDGVIWPN